MNGFVSRKRRKTALKTEPSKENPSIIASCESTINESKTSSSPTNDESIFPTEWRYLHCHSNTTGKTNLLFGASFCLETLSYDFYITDITSTVWHEKVTADEFKQKAKASELNSNPIDLIFTTITDLFRCQFVRKDFPIKVHLSVNNKKEIDLNVEQDFGYIQSTWLFSLKKLSSTDAIPVLASLIFQLSSIISTQQNYQMELLKQMEKKDSTIRYFHESLKGIRNGDGIINRYGGNLQCFQPEEFKKLYTERANKKGLDFSNEFDIIRDNEKNGSWDFHIVPKKNNVDDKMKTENITTDDDDDSILIKNEFQSFYGGISKEFANENDDKGETPSSDKLQEKKILINIKQEEDKPPLIPTKQLECPTPQISNLLDQFPPNQPIRQGFVSRKRKVKRDI